MNELHSRNLFIASTLQQKLDRFRIVPTQDRLSQYLSPAGGSSTSVTSEPQPYNEKNERRMIDEFINHSLVYHEKLRRQLSSTDREIDSNKNSLLRMEEDRYDKELYLRDLRGEVAGKFEELEKRTKQVNKWKNLHEKVSKQLSDLQERFVPQYTENSGSPLDGMRRNLTRLLSENKDLTSQLQFMNKQLGLFEVKLRASKLEISKNTTDSAPPNLPSSDEHVSKVNSEGLMLASTNLLSGGSVDSRAAEVVQESLVSPKEGLTACNLYLKNISDSHLPGAVLTGFKSSLLDLFGREFFSSWKYAQIMFSLSEALQYMATLRDLNKAVQFLMGAICKLCECDRSSYWVIDKSRGIAWTRVPAFVPAGRDDRTNDSRIMGMRRSSIIESDDDSSVIDRNRDPLNVVDDANGSTEKRMTTLMIPVNTGLVGAAFKSGQVINIPDAYADSRFNRMVDLKTEYRTRSVLCFPIVYQNQVLGVTQCINKISPSSRTFNETDIYVVKTLGSAMLSVLASCHSHEEGRKQQIRRSVLVEAADEMTRKMSNRKELVGLLRDKMKKLFRANECAVILVYKDFFSRVAVEYDGSLGLVCADRSTDGPASFVDYCVSRAQPIHVFGRQEVDKYSPSKADIDSIGAGVFENSNSSTLAEGDVSVHSWPLLSPVWTGEVSAVIQWVCLDRSLIAFGDDGAFNEKNSEHVDLVSRFMDLLGYYVEHFWPSKYRLGWTKSKHLQLKVRGMISFNSARTVGDGARVRDPRIAAAAPPTNRKIIDLWHRAKRWALTAGIGLSGGGSGGYSPSRQTVRRSTSVDFMEKMKREREAMSKRKTVIVSQSSIEELRAIAQANQSPFARLGLKTSVLPRTEEESSDSLESSGGSSSRGDTSSENLSENE